MDRVTPKTDKELATDIAIAYLQSWNSRPANTAMQPNHVVDILETVYKSLSQLPEQK